MTTTSQKFKRNAMALVATLAVIAGVVVVASSGSHPTSTHRAHTAKTHASKVARSGALAIAASYIGLSRPQLRQALRTHGTLAAVANATAGKSASGLIAALLRARTATLEERSASSAAAQAKLRGRLERLRERVTAEVHRSRGHHRSKGRRSQPAKHG